MRYICFVLCLVCIFLVNTTKGQEATRREKNQWIYVPREVALPVIASQPDCPLQFEKLEELISTDYRRGNLYLLRNRSTKPIRSFTASYTYGDGTGGWWTWKRNSGELIMPGQLVPDWEGGKPETVPLTEELRDKLKLRGPMKTIIVYMIERVEFADGSVYSDEKTAKALQTFFEDIGNKINRLENLQRQQK